MASYEIEKISENDEVGNIMQNQFVSEFCEGFVTVGEQKTVMSTNYLKFAEAIRDFDVRNSDVILCTFPKSGSTWTQEMIWLIANDLDYEGAKIEIQKRFPMLETCTHINWEKVYNFMDVEPKDCMTNSVKYVKNLPSPRFIKIHMAFPLLPQEIQNGTKSPKIIYLIRNPKDVSVSYYHHSKVFFNWRANLEDFSKVFLADKIMMGPYWKHILGFWEKRDFLNMLIITFEEMKKDLPSVIRRVADFLKKELTEEQIQQLCEHLSFESMKNNKALNREDVIEVRKKNNMVYEDTAFIRSGVVGKHKEEMSPETVEKFNSWIKENIADTSFSQEYNYYLP